MGMLQFQTKLMAAVLVTFLLAALQAPAILRSCGIAFESRSTGSRKMNAGTESRFQHKGEKLEGISMMSLRERGRSLTSKRRVPSPPPAPNRNRQKTTLKPVKPVASPPCINYAH